MGSISDIFSRKEPLFGCSTVPIIDPGDEDTDEDEDDEVASSDVTEESETE